MDAEENALVPLTRMHSSSEMRSWATSSAWPKACCLELLVAVEIGKGADQGGSGGLRYPPQILLLAPPHCHGTLLNEVLEAEVVDALCGHDDVGASLQRSSQCAR